MDKYIGLILRVREGDNDAFAQLCEQYKNLMDRGLKIAVVPIIAYLNFKYLKKIAGFINKGLSSGEVKDENK